MIDSSAHDVRHLSGRQFSMATAAKAVAATLVGLVAAWLLLTGKPTPVPTAPDAVRRPVVDIVVAEPRARSLTVQTQGTVEPLTRIALVAQVGGIVEAVAADFRQGGFFRAGDVLLKIEQDDYRFAIARAESAVAGAEQLLAEERGRARQAEREWRDLGAVQANDLFLRKPQINAAEAALRAARADLAAAQLALARTAISAPFDGRIEARRANLGQYVAPGTPLADVYAADIMEVRLPLTDSQIALLDLPGFDGTGISPPVATLTSRFGGRDWSWQGVIRRTEAQVDRANRVVYAIAEVDLTSLPVQQGRPPLSPGMFVAASINGRELPAITLLPATALRADNTVLTVGPDEQLVRTSVDVLLRRGGLAWVSGLAPDTPVVAQQSSSLVAGAFVEIRDTLAVEGL